METIDTVSLCFPLFLWVFYVLGGFFVVFHVK